MPVDRVREILKISQEPVSLETPIGEEEDSHLGDFIQDDNVPVPAEAAAQTLLKEQLDEVLSTLTVADLVTPGMRLADVGTDHAYIPIYLTQNGLVPSAIAMDINKGPLERADTHILEHGLDGKIVTRLSDGLVNLKMEEADTMIAAGMGGGLVIHILNEDPAKTRSLKELILQPQSELAKVRRYLEEHRFRIVAEDMVEEDGKYYPMMKVIPTEQKGLYAEGVPAAEEELEYGKYLLEKGHPVMGEYLKKELSVNQGVYEKLRVQESERTKERSAEILHMIKRAEDLLDRYF